jgi:hypothetical protein
MVRGGQGWLKSEKKEAGTQLKETNPHERVFSFARLRLL